MLPLRHVEPVIALVAGSRRARAGPGRLRRQDRLRLPRPRGLPAAVAQRLLHRRRSVDAHRPPPEPPARRDAQERPRQADRARRLQPQRRLRPRLADPHEGPRARQPGGVRQDRPRARDRHGARLRARPARRRHRRRHRRAPADLGRARLAGERERRPQPVHPPGQELPRGPPLHRRPAQPQARRRLDDRAAARLPRLPRRDRHDVSGGRGAAGTHGGAVRDARPRRSPPQRPLPGVGLHGRQRAADRRAAARDARHGARRARRRRAPERPRGVPAGRPAGPPGRRGDHARVRHVHGAVLPRPGRLPDGLALRVRRRQEQRPGAARGQHDGSPITTASSARTPPTGRRGWRSTATACSAMPPRSTSPPQRAMVKRFNFAYCATDWVGMSTLDDPNVVHDPQRPLALPDAHRPCSSRRS